jgi:hypothetical protein
MPQARPSEFSAQAGTKHLPAATLHQRTTLLSTSIIINILKLTAIHPVSSVETQGRMLKYYANECFQKWSDTTTT